MKTLLNVLIALSFITVLLMGCTKKEETHSAEAASQVEVNKQMVGEEQKSEPGGWSPPAE
jgi:hypothetical protein